MALESTPDEIKAFLEQLAAQAEITDFIQNLGRDLGPRGPHQWPATPVTQVGRPSDLGGPRPSDTTL
jgi:hypothetical protein